MQEIAVDLHRPDDLRFTPAPAQSRPKALTAEQVRQYNERGYVAGVRVFDEAQAAANRSTFDAIFAQYQARGLNGYSVIYAHRTCESIYAIATHKAILDCVEDILGPDIICWNSHFFCKLPGDPKQVAWHQDAPYWPLHPAHSVTVWVAIDDADDGNSAMRVIPGTHRLGAIPARESRTSEENILQLTIDDAERLGDPLTLALRAGEISLHSDLLVHGSRPNTSDRRRCGLTLRYTNSRVRANNPSWRSNVIVCRGSDGDGHWRACARPIGDHPFRDESGREHRKTAREWIRAISDLLAGNPEAARTIGASYLFELEGDDGGPFLLDLKDRGIVREGRGDADCTLRMKASDFVAMVEGRVDPTRLLFENRVVLEGDIRHAAKLEQLSSLWRD